MLRYRKAKQSEYLMITGFCIKDIKLTKKGWILPGQSYTRINISPIDCMFNVQAMSAEKLLVSLRVFFTIRRPSEHKESLLKYAKLIIPSYGHNEYSDYVKERVKRMMEREIRVLAASMTMKDIFKGIEEFKHEVTKKVELELRQFALKICNVKCVLNQLNEVPSLGPKTQTKAETEVKVDEAKAKIITTQRKGEPQKHNENPREAELAKKVKDGAAASRTTDAFSYSSTSAAIFDMSHGDATYHCSFHHHHC